MKTKSSKILIDIFFSIKNLEKIMNISVRKIGIANLTTGEKFNQKNKYTKQKK